MKRLWKIVAPCLSDIAGFQEVMNRTGGLGIVDDASHYKPLKRGQRRHKGREKYSQEMRVISSELEEIDIIQGSEGKLHKAAQQAIPFFQPPFILLAMAPCASMINPDLETVAQTLAEQYQIPAGVCPLDGQKDYFHGVREATTALGKLLLQPQATRPQTLNLLGLDSLNWSHEMIEDLKHWAKQAGYEVLTCWSTDDVSQLQMASAAALNLVVSVTGLDLAQYMEETFQIPYLVGIPLGQAEQTRLQAALQGQIAQPIYPQGSGRALIIGEQVMANALRLNLWQRGYQEVIVASLFDMDKASMQPGDLKLNGEDDIKQLLDQQPWDLLIAEPDIQQMSEAAGIALPNAYRLSPSMVVEPFAMIGTCTDHWLDQELKEE